MGFGCHLNLGTEPQQVYEHFDYLAKTGSRQLIFMMIIVVLVVAMEAVVVFTAWWSRSTHARLGLGALRSTSLLPEGG